ncbi:MAG: biotin/lipoyl-containing protein, partial [Phycisphaerales bacterium]
MPIEVTMPRLSDTMQQGTVVKWNVKEGDAVKTGDILADIETDKATMELESFDDGTVAVLAAGEGDNVAIGEVIVVLAGKGEDAKDVKASFGGKKQGSSAEPAEKKSGGEKQAAEGASSNGKASSNGAATAVAEEDDHEDSHGGSEVGGHSGGGRIFASPLAKKVADEMGVDLAEVKGTGPSGRIVKADVEAAAKGGAPASQARGESRAESRGQAPAPMMPPVGAALEKKTVALSNMRRTIATRLVESKTTVP